MLRVGQRGEWVSQGLLATVLRVGHGWVKIRTDQPFRWQPGEAVRQQAWIEERKLKPE